MGVGVRVGMGVEEGVGGGGEVCVGGAEDEDCFGAAVGGEGGEVGGWEDPGLFLFSEVKGRRSEEGGG